MLSLAGSKRGGCSPLSGFELLSDRHPDSAKFANSFKEPSRENSKAAIPTGLSGPAVHVFDRFTNSQRKASSPRPTSYEAHSVAPQEQLEGTGITRKSGPNSRSLYPHLQWWLKEDNVLTGQPLHPIKHALQVFTDASKEGWGAHLNHHSASKLHINYLELKAVFLALKEFQDLCADKIVLVATDNTTVVSYINKEGDRRPDPLCALLWRILTWCTRKQVILKARDIPGQLNVVADKLSRLGQTIQTEWFLLPEVFQSGASLIRWTSGHPL